MGVVNPLDVDLERARARARMLGRNRALAERASKMTGPAESPLSGEWAGDPTARSLAEFLGIEGDPDAIDLACDDYETAYAEAWEEGL